jgi:DNA-directed RNA polymerase specialized sigma24 family protein
VSPALELPVEDIAEAYRGATLEELADRYGCSIYAVRSRLREVGVPRRRQGPRSDPVKDRRVLELRAGGLSTYDIAFCMDCSRQAIQSRLTRLGVRK